MHHVKYMCPFCEEEEPPTLEIWIDVPPPGVATANRSDTATVVLDMQWAPQPAPCEHLRALLIELKQLHKQMVHDSARFLLNHTLGIHKQYFSLLGAKHRGDQKQN